MPISLSHLTLPPVSAAMSAVMKSTALSSAASAHGAWTTRYENVLGTSMQLTLRAANRMDAEQAETALLAVIDHHDRLLSAWRTDSELNRWLATRGTAEKISPELFDVLALFDQWRERTGGAIDASAEAAIRTWQNAASERREPSSGELAQAVAAMQQRHWRLDAANGTATRLSGTALVLASFTKSYIADRAVDAALVAGASGAMLNLGGDIVIRGDLTQLVKLADPFAHGENDRAFDLLALRDRSVATSGSYRRGFSVDGSSDPQFSHIVDPRTALPAGHIASSTVIAREPATAGALATAFSILNVDETRELAANLPGTEYLLITREGERIASDGWGSFQTVQAKKKPAPAAASDAWNQSYELAIDLEVATQNGPRSHRPYVAVWIEDDHHESVRTVALWFDGKMRYLPEMRDWWHDNQMRVGEGHPDVTGTVTSATRSPGKYNLKWDGKDDDGKLLKPGKYTVCIEAAREHGGTQIIRQELNFNGTPQQQAIPAGAELGPVTLDYRKP